MSNGLERESPFGQAAYEGYADESGKPPVGRPPGPVPGTSRNGMTPHSPNAASEKGATACLTSYSMSPEAFWGQVRGVISREWIRLSQGTENVDVGLNLNDRYTHMMEDLVDAMKAGKVVPGLTMASDGKCVMDWYLLACFARYYGKQVGWIRDDMREKIRNGMTLEEMAQDELHGIYEWRFCEDPSKIDPDEREWCCAEDVRKDWYYADLAAGRTPGEKTTNWLPIVAIGLGAAAMVAAVMLSARSEAPTSQRPGQLPARSNPSVDHTSSDLARRVKRLRKSTAALHAFEDWDETSRYVLGESSYPTAEISMAAQDAQRLVDQLRGMGVRTTLGYELENMLEMSAEAVA